MEKSTEVTVTSGQQVLDMGGYAAYVWPSFIIAFVVLAVMVIASVRSLRKAERTLAELQQSASANQ
jgi:heme exporter protein D